MLSRAAAAFVFGVGVFVSAVGAEETPLQKVLIPVYTPDPIPGLNGSSWITDFRMSNFGNDIVEAEGIWWECFLPECGNLPAPLEPGVSFRPMVQNTDGSLRGVFLYLNAAGADQIGLGLRFRDLSRQATTGGTELPAPREDAFRAGKLVLVDVPVTGGFRQTLRIYELDGTPRDASVRVRVYRIDPAQEQPYGVPDELLGESIVGLTFAPPFGPRFDHPGYAEVRDLATLAPLAPLGNAEHLRLEIEPVTPGLRLWAFVTVIHNESQHATVISPQ